MPEYLKVQSSLISEVYYDPDAEELRVRFKKGDEWLYRAVAPETYDALVAADSIGKFFLTRIKGVYEGVKQ